MCYQPQVLAQMSVNSSSHPIPLVPYICVSESVGIGLDNGFSVKPLFESMLWHFHCTLRNKLKWNFNRSPYIPMQENASENVVQKMAAILSRHRCVKSILGKKCFSARRRRANDLSLYLFHNSSERVDPVCKVHFGLKCCLWFIESGMRQ